jgi:hypothetical protein
MIGRFHFLRRHAPGPSPRTPVFDVYKLTSATRPVVIGQNACSQALHAIFTSSQALQRPPTLEWLNGVMECWSVARAMPGMDTALVVADKKRWSLHGVLHANLCKIMQICANLAKSGRTAIGFGGEKFAGTNVRMRLSAPTPPPPPLLTHDTMTNQ